MKYKVRAIVTVDLVWECEATSKDQALKKFWGRDATELVSEGKVLNMETDNETVKKS